MEVSVKWIPNQASHGFLAWSADLRGRQGLAVGTNANKVASRALLGIFSGCRASKMEIPAQ